MAKKTTKKKEDILNLDNILFKCRDILRQAKNAGSFFEKRDMMLTLVFLRFIGEKYEDSIVELRQTLIDEGLDPDDENIRMAFFEDMDGTYALPEEAFSYYCLGTQDNLSRRRNVDKCAICKIEGI